MEQVDSVLRPGDQGALRQEAAAEAPALFVRFLCPRGAGHRLPWVVQEAWLLCLVLPLAGCVTLGQAALKLDLSGST